MYKHLPQWITDKLFPTIHQRIVEKNAQDKRLAKFKKHRDAAYLGIDRRKQRARRITDTANDVELSA